MRRKTILRLFTISLISIGILVGFYANRLIAPFVFIVWTVFALTSATFVQQVCVINLKKKRIKIYENSNQLSAKVTTA